MRVTDKDLLIATQIAYADLDIALEALSKDGQRNVNLGEAFEYTIKHNNKMWDDYEMYFDISRDEKGKVISATLKDEYAHIANWSIISAKNDNHPGESGFYACILDTGKERIVGCRGSESLAQIENYIKDWVNADFKLLNSTQTSQEKVLMDYLKENKELLSEKPWVSTGHSLGGALADHAAILSVVLDIANYVGTVNFDGPGHSTEYLEKYKDEIAAVASKMTHYKASVVGSLLQDLPGVKQEFITTSKESRLKKDDGTPIKTLGTVDFLSRHSTQFWVFDENNNFIPRNQDAFEYIFEKITKAADWLPKEIGDRLPEILAVLGVSAIWVKDFLDKHPKLRDEIIRNGVLYIISHPTIILTVLEVAKIVVGVALLVIGVEILVEKIYELGNIIAQGICDAVEWLKGKSAELFDAICDVVNNIGNWFNEKFNKGVGYSKENPYFKADTAKLRDYAYRLESLNRRIQALDRGMNDLYWQVGLLDILDILQADLLTHYSWSLNQAKKYLYNTADRLETAERNAQNYLGG